MMSFQLIDVMEKYRLLFKSFHSLKRVWKEMETPDMSPFLHYDYMRFIKTSVTWFKPFFTRIACVCPKDSDEILMICPMKRRIDFKYYTLLGDMQGCDIADLLWKQGISEEEKKDIIHFFFERMKDKMFLNRIPADSLFASGVPMDRISYTRDVEYVAIDMQEDYPAYLRTVSKNMRHQINKTYNRLEREGVEQKLLIYDAPNRVPRELERKINQMYITRLISRYNPEREGSKLWRAYYWILFQYLKHDTRSFRKLPNSFLAVVMSGEQVMAFVSGFKTHDGKTVSMTRLAINEDLDYYSPGRILMNELIKYLHAETPIKVLDMSRGDERYKKDFGGRSYFIKDFVVEKA